MEKLLYGIPEVAPLLGICQNTAYKLVKKGDIPAIKLGRRLFVTAKALEQMLNGGCWTQEHAE